MDKSKLIAIVALVLGIGLIGFFKEKPLAPDEDDDHHDAPAAQSSPAPGGKDAGGKEAGSKADADPSGGITQLQTKDMRVGKGTLAKAGDKVTVNYRGTLLNGQLFDESYGKAPFDFQLGQGGVIAGWDKGVAGMKVGGKRQLVIPPDMAYGAAGQGPIPPNATLKFDVELLQVNGKG